MWKNKVNDGWINCILIVSFSTMVFQNVVEICLKSMGEFYVNFCGEMPFCSCEQLRDSCGRLLRNEVLFSTANRFSWRVVVLPC